MISLDTAAAFEKFTAIVKRSMQSRAKDIRMDVCEANLLVIEMANVLARLAVLENAAAPKQASAARMDGGSF